MVSHMDTDMGLAKVCDLLKLHDPHLTESASEQKTKELSNGFPKAAFENVMVAEIVQGMELTTETSYSDFIKDKNLDLKDLNRDLNSYVPITVDTALLDQERLSRKEVVNLFSTLHYLDLFGEKIDNLTEATKADAQISSSITKAIARSLLSTLKVAIMKWMTAKMRVRSAICKQK